MRRSGWGAGRAVARGASSRSLASARSVLALGCAALGIGCAALAMGCAGATTSPGTSSAETVASGSDGDRARSSTTLSASETQPVIAVRAATDDVADVGAPPTPEPTPALEGAPLVAARSEPIPATPSDALLALATLSPSLSTSIGGPTDGRLEGGIALPALGPGFRSNPARPNPDAYYGTLETVRALVRAAAVVHAELPGSELVINDIGFREGGPIPHHGSHRAGRDVDVLFYYFDREGNPWPAKGVPVDRRGRGWDFGDLADPRDDVRVRLDVARTWRFVQALLEDEDPGSPLQRIFLAEHVRALLLEHAERVRAPRAVRERFADLTCQPSHPHDDHLHLRFFCSAEDLRAGCADGAPMYPWRRRQLLAQGVEPVMARPRPGRRRAPASGDEPREGADQDARTSSAPMHARVRAFLEERATWSTQPHPGRRYCR